MPLRTKKKPAWKLELERAATIAAVSRTSSAAARRNQIADDEYRATLLAERLQRQALLASSATPAKPAEAK